MKKKSISLVIFIFISAQVIVPITTYANTQFEYVNNNKGKSIINSTKSEKDDISKKEQEMINNMEILLKEKSNSKILFNNKCIFGINEEQLENTAAWMAFEFVFKKTNPYIDVNGFFNLIDKATNLLPESKWFKNLHNKSERYITVFDAPTNKNIKLHAYYIDNKSNKTVILQHGYRGNPMTLCREAKFFSDEGYNVLLPDARSEGKSEGKYITFGYYEKNDINRWINQELQKKPNQDIILFGQSMGAATVMMSQGNILNKNVKAIIEDCGYANMDEELKSVMNILIKRLKYIYPRIKDWNKFENKTIEILNNKYIKPKLKFDLKNISPIDSVHQSNIPKLFIHGSSDWLIPQIEEDELYNASSGYKEKLIVNGAEHAENFGKGGEVYKSKVKKFLNIVFKGNDY